MTQRETFVIVGAGLAGAKAAETLREEGFEGRLVLVGDEHELPYERPPLSKQYLLGEAPRDGAHVHPAEFYEEQRIELVTGVAATELDAVEHRVTLADGRSLSYDRLLIATGATPRRPPIDGIDRARTLRTLPDSDALLAAFGDRGTVAVIGAGWIGSEVAAAARGHGCEVALIEQAATPLEGVLGGELGALFADLHRSHGVNLVCGAGVAAIDADRVRLTDGTEIACEIVVVGVGVAPDTRLAEAAGLDIDDGILVDEHLRTSAEDVFAAGDVANALHPHFGRRVRVEHWANALNQGPAAARSMLGGSEPYAKLPYFFSDQYELGMEYIGLHSANDRLVIRREGDELALRALWLDAENRVTAGMHVNEWDTIETIERMIESREAVEPEAALVAGQA
jgi:3-phenylpropionate/trans-cinnamate dioxygenase ferredoxin reductase component